MTLGSAAAEEGSASSRSSRSLVWMVPPWDSASVTFQAWRDEAEGRKAEDGRGLGGFLSPFAFRLAPYFFFTLCRVCRRRRGEYFLSPSLSFSGIPPLVLTSVR